MLEGSVRLCSIRGSYAIAFTTGWRSSPFLAAREWKTRLEMDKLSDVLNKAYGYIIRRGDEMLSLVKNKTKRNPNLYSRTIVLGDMLYTKEYDSFESLRRGANKALATMRENWLREVLKIHGVKHTKKDLTRREIQENLLANAIRIEREVTGGRDVDKVYKEDVLIGEWNNKRSIKIDFDGRLAVTIEYYIKPPSSN